MIEELVHAMNGMFGSSMGEMANMTLSLGLVLMGAIGVIRIGGRYVRSISEVLASRRNIADAPAPPQQAQTSQG